MNPPAEASTLERPASLGGWVLWLGRRVWLSPVLATLAVGLFQVGRPELWRDELRSWSAASRDVGDLFHLLGQTDAAVSLYYLILHYWMVTFGDSIVAMRLLSVLAMGAAAATVSLIGRRLYGPRAGLVAGLLFAVIPSVSRFAQEVRPYAIALFLAGLSTLLLLRAVEKPRWARLFAYGLSAALLILMQVVMAFPLLVVHGIGALLWAGRDRRLLVKLGSVVIAAVVVASPVVLLSRSQYAHQVGALPQATLTELTKLPARLFASGVVAGVIVGLALVAFSRERWRPFAFGLALAVVPPAAVWIVSQGPNSYWMTRYSLVALLGFTILAAAGAAAIRFPAAAAITVAAVALVGISDQRSIRDVGSHDVWNYPDPNPQFFNYSLVAETIAANMQPGDGIVYAERDHFWLADIGIAYHLRNRDQPVDVFVQTSAVERGDFWPVECAPLSFCRPSQDRLWLVSVDWVWEEDPLRWMDEEKADLLREDYVVTRRYPTVPIDDRYTPTDFGLVLTLLERR